MLLKGIYTHQNEYVTEANKDAKIFEDSIDQQKDSQLEVGDRLLPTANYQRILQRNFITAKLCFDEGKSFIEYENLVDNLRPKDRKELGKKFEDNFKEDIKNKIVFKEASQEAEQKFFFDLA